MLQEGIQLVCLADFLQGLIGQILLRFRLLIEVALSWDPCLQRVSL